jgi:hypothetical protein
MAISFVEPTTYLLPGWIKNKYKYRPQGLALTFELQALQRDERVVVGPFEHLRCSLFRFGGVVIWTGIWLWS